MGYYSLESIKNAVQSALEGQILDDVDLCTKQLHQLRTAIIFGAYLQSIGTVEKEVPNAYKLVLDLSKVEIEIEEHATNMRIPSQISIEGLNTVGESFFRIYEHYKGIVPNEEYVRKMLQEELDDTEKVYYEDKDRFLHLYVKSHMIGEVLRDFEKDAHYGDKFLRTLDFLNQIADHWGIDFKLNEKLECEYICRHTDEHHIYGDLLFAVNQISPVFYAEENALVISWLGKPKIVLKKTNENTWENAQNDQQLLNRSLIHQQLCKN